MGVSSQFNFFFSKDGAKFTINPVFHRTWSTNGPHGTNMTPDNGDQQMGDGNVSTVYQPKEWDKLPTYEEATGPGGNIQAQQTSSHI